VHGIVRKYIFFGRKIDMGEFELKKRGKELQEEMEKAKAAMEDGRLSVKRYNGMMGNALEEATSIANALENLKKYKSAFRHPGDLNAGSAVPGMSQPAFEGPLSPMDATEEQWATLHRAMEMKTPCQIEITQKRVSGGMVDKSAVTVSGLGGGFSGNLPPIQSAYAVGLGYEPTRVSTLFPGAAMPGPSATWLSHTGNSAEVAGVAELGTKGDLGPTITENQVVPQKVAGLISTSLEAWQDTGQYGQASFSTWLPQELTRSLINTESKYVLLATTAGTNSISGGPVSSTFNGLLNVSGTLTRGVGPDTALDALNKAFNDVRVGAAFAEPDLLLLHPTTWASLRRVKDTQGRYVLELLTGPLGLTVDGTNYGAPANEPNSFSIVPQGRPAGYGSLWGVKVACSTHVPAGTGVVLSVSAGGGIFWTRMGLSLMFNPWGDTEWTTNQFSWRAEERIAFSVPRPSAVNIVTGLPTS
jgi:hypothetical protein